MLIAAGRGPARMPTCEQALRDGQTKLYHVIAASDEDWFLANQLRYDLQFDKWQDDYNAKTRVLRKTEDLSLATKRTLSGCLLVFRLRLAAPSVAG
jgi:hypothetical protein